MNKEIEAKYDKLYESYLDWYNPDILKEGNFLLYQINILIIFQKIMNQNILRLIGIPLKNS